MSKKRISERQPATNHKKALKEGVKTSKGKTITRYNAMKQRVMKVERNLVGWEKDYKEKFSFTRKGKLLDQLDPQKKREKTKNIIANLGTERMLRYESINDGNSLMISTFLCQ